MKNTILLLALLFASKSFAFIIGEWAGDGKAKVTNHQKGWVTSYDSKCRLAMNYDVSASKISAPFISVDCGIVDMWTESWSVERRDNELYFKDKKVGTTTPEGFEIELSSTRKETYMAKHYIGCELQGFWKQHVNLKSKVKWRFAYVSQTEVAVERISEDEQLNSFFEHSPGCHKPLEVHHKGKIVRSLQVVLQKWKPSNEKPAVQP